MTSNNEKKYNPKFSNCLPASRLGKSHPTLDAYRQAVSQQNTPTTTSTEFTLVVVTGSKHKQNNKRILLGMKHRGFGKGMYNSFGGKFDHPNESVEECACRELQEETNIGISTEAMKDHKVGIQRYTFDKDPVEMIMHVFCLDMDTMDNPKQQYNNILGCEEITPEWFDDWNKIPLDNMFADDSLWLTTLLSSSSLSPVQIRINGWYHFQENCQETNTILHYYMDVQEPKQAAVANANANTNADANSNFAAPSFSLEQRLFHAIHDKKIRSPTVKEFKECFAFCTAVRSSFGKKSKASKIEFDVVIDVAGGHGALAAMFLIGTSAKKAVVVDPAQVGQNSVERAWKEQFYPKQTLLYRTECLRTGLPAEIKDALSWTSQESILVVACHACQHLSEEILDICCRYGVHAAVMPCCQKDLSQGSSWKASSKNLSISNDKVMDLLLSGKVMGKGTHEVRMKCINEKITPQNRIIVCRALTENSLIETRRQAQVDKAHAKLETAYRKAHGVSTTNKRNTGLSNLSLPPPVLYLAIGFAAGAFTALTVSRR